MCMSNVCQLDYSMFEIDDFPFILCLVRDVCKHTILVIFYLDLNPNLFPFLSIMTMMSLMDSSSPKTHKMRYYTYSCNEYVNFQSSTGGHLGLGIFRVFAPDIEFGTYHMLFLGFKLV